MGQSFYSIVFLVYTLTVTALVVVVGLLPTGKRLGSIHRHWSSPGF